MGNIFADYKAVDTNQQVCGGSELFGHKMNTRSKLLWSLSGLFLGLAIGVAATWIFLGKTSQAVLKNMTSCIVAEHLYHAELLRRGEDKKVLDNLEQTFPASVQWFTVFDYSDEFSHNTLWAIRDYYEKNGLEIPALARPVLTTLPPK